MKKPVISKKISAGTRVYYFDGYVDGKGQPFVSVSEIPTNNAPGNRKRQKVFVHAENFEKFSDAFAEIANYIKNDFNK